MHIPSLQISREEYQARAEKLSDYIKAETLSGTVLFDAYYILYYTGFAFIPTERPMAFLINDRGEKALFVPRLEAEHAQANAMIDRVKHYIEYPFDQHPMMVLKELMEEMQIQGDIGVDTDGYPWVFGYRGPSLSQLCACRPRIIAAFIEDQMMIKSAAELGLIRESVKWGNLAHTLLQRYTRVGLTETEVGQRATAEATLSMLDSIGPVYRAQSAFFDGASAGYRGQIGRNAAIPHSLANNIAFQPGDVLVTGADAPVWGYHSELERTMLVAPVGDEQRRMFDHMLALQETALNTIRPGIACADVDLAVRKYYQEHNLMQYWKHHVGHAIGLRYHEAPFLDRGDRTEIKPGMVFTVEPGLYVPGLGGFRHSDTVVVTDDGIDLMTYYPRDLESLTIS
jgi:Xaa-Pro aminopeptidase